jgi:lipoyl(octanoyl) transferase
MTDTWRFIDSGPCSAAYNMALDEAIAVTVRKNQAPPTLRLYGWDLPSVTIGYFQKMAEVDVAYCFQKNIPVIRRPTGGRAILHGNEITYSFSVKTRTGFFSKSLLDSYKTISAAFSNAFLKIGVLPELKLLKDSRRESDAVMQKNPLCFESVSYGEMTVNSKKIIGAAQKRWTDSLLQQGSIPFVIERDALVKVFKMDTARDIRDSFTGLHDILPDLIPDDLKTAIRLSFEETFDTRLTISSPSAEEIALARELETGKYLSRDWNHRR